MRITTGKYKGTILNSPNDGKIRPTSDKVRQAIFNKLQHAAWKYDLGFTLDDAVVLDLFCGTGALGFEALSHGASSCIFIDKNTKLVKQNAQKFFEEKMIFVQKDILKISQNPLKNHKANLVFMDPPYKQDMADKTLEKLNDLKALEDNTLIVVEEHKTVIDTLNLPENMQPLEAKKYGDTAVLFVHAKNTYAQILNKDVHRHPRAQSHEATG